MAAYASLLAASATLRVASLDLCADEYLLMLARPEEIATVSRLSRDPADSPLWRQGRRYPGNKGTLESALASKPTLLLKMGGGGRGTTLIARRIGLRTIDLPVPASVADVERNMTLVASALGAPKRADAWRARFARLNRPPSHRDAIFLSGGGRTVASRSLSAQWMELAGLRQRYVAGGRVGLETLLLHPPQVLLRSDYRRSEVSLGQRWLDHPMVRSARSRTIPTDGRRWTCSGPLMLREIERLQVLP